MKVTNHTGQELTFREDITVLAGGVPIGLMEPAMVAKQVRQSVPAYLLYNLLGIWIGPPISIGNMIVAGVANKNFKNELYANNVLSSTIADGETIYGLIGVSDMGYRPLSVRLKSATKPKQRKLEKTSYYGY